MKTRSAAAQTHVAQRRDVEATPTQGAAQTHVAQRRDVEAKPIQVGLLGIGTVGGGTFKVLQRNQEEIRRRAGRAIRIAAVADLDQARARSIVGDAAPVVDGARRVLAGPAIDIVI